MEKLSILYTTDMENKPKSPYWQAFNLAWELGYLIVIPLVIFALAGRYADHHFGTTPWLFLTGVVVAMGSTTVLLIRKFTILMHDIERPNESTNKSNKKSTYESTND